MADKARLRAIAIGGTRGRGNINGPGSSDNDQPSGNGIVSRLTTDPKGGTSTYTFPMNGSPGSKYPANQMNKTITKTQVTPGDWKSKDKLPPC